MSISAILSPVFVQVALTLFLLFRMGSARFGSLKRGEVRVVDIALAQPAWPEAATKASNAYHNQFQIPVLFYVLVSLALVTRQADLLFVAMSWVFVATRLAHAAVHVTTNHVPTRFRLFVVGVFVLMVMWAIFALRILLRDGPF